MIGWPWRGVSSPEVLRDRRSRSTGAEGEVPQAPSNRSAASHEGEESPAAANTAKFVPIAQLDHNKIKYLR